jgi:TPR repeat protein
LRACDGNTPRGCFMAGRAYGLAQGVAKDDERAKEFYTRGCDGNFAPACAAMGKSANLPAEATAWLSSADYHTIWDKQRANGFYPGHVEGRLNNGREEFRATAWEPVTATCQTRSHHSLTEDNYRRASTDYAAQGFGLKSVSQFVGLGGGVKYQAVWTKGCEP